MVRFLKPTALALLVGAMSCGAASATIYNLNPPTGDLETNTSQTRTFTTGAAGSGTLAFALQGYNSLDGTNFYEDDLRITLNGAQIFFGSFDLGGGGNNQLFAANAGTTYTVTPVSTGNPTFAGGLLTASTPISFASGPNTIVFSYTSLPAPGHAGFQGIGDEGWGINSASVTSGVPEPSTWALMLAGLAGLGLFARRQRARTA